MFISVHREVVLNLSVFSDRLILFLFFFFFSSRRRHTRYWRDWSSDVCSSDLTPREGMRELVIDSAMQLGIGDENPQLMSIFALADPVRYGAKILDVLSRVPPDGGGDANAAHLFGLTASVLGDFEVAVPFLTAAVSGLRTQGRFTWLSRMLMGRAWA